MCVCGCIYVCNIEYIEYHNIMQAKQKLAQLYSLFLGPCIVGAGISIIIPHILQSLPHLHPQSSCVSCSIDRSFVRFSPSKNNYLGCCYILYIFIAFYSIGIYVYKFTRIVILQLTICHTRTQVIIQCKRDYFLPRIARK